VVWTIPSPWPKSCRRRPSSLYTFLSRGLARDWRWLLPLAFPDFERFYSQRFRWGTPIQVCCVYRFRHVRITRDFSSQDGSTFNDIIQYHNSCKLSAVHVAWPRTLGGRAPRRVFILTPSSLLNSIDNEASRRDSPMTSAPSGLWTVLGAGVAGLPVTRSPRCFSWLCPHPAPLWSAPTKAASSGRGPRAAGRGPRNGYRRRNGRLGAYTPPSRIGG